MSAKNKRLMEKPKASRRGFIAKLLVLCMIVGLVPTVSLVASADGGNDSYYSINADANGGTVEVCYTVDNDTITHQLDSTYYDIKGDVTKLEVKITPASGKELKSATYQIGNKSAVNFNVSASGGTYEIPASAFSNVTMNEQTAAKIHVVATFADKQSGGSTGGGGGGSSATVNTSSAKNGSFAVSDKNAKAGDTVKVTPKPDKGFVVDNVVVKDKNGDSVPVTKNADGTFSFVMPDKKLQPVTVDVAFREELVTDIYTDVPADAWYATAVKYCYDNGLMTGVGDGEFSPETTTTRGQVVTVLWNIEGQPSVSGTGGFDDVASGDWYAPAIAWAKASGVVGGYSATQFGPKDEMTREQLAVVMWRYAEYKGYNTQLTADLSGYTDAGQISDWAEAGMEWANHEGLINGTSATTLAPVESSTRGQLAQIFMSYCENVVK